MTLRVVYFNNIPSPYVVGRFNALAATGRVTFTAWFTERTQPDRSWDVDESSWRFAARYVTSPQELRAAMRDDRPDVLVTIYEDVPHLRAAVAARRRGARVLFRVLPTFDTWIRRRAHREAVKHVAFRLIDGAEVPGPDGAAFAGRYGLPADRCHVVTQSVDVDHYGSGAGAAAALRSRHASPDETVFVYAGRMWNGKGVAHLIEAQRRVTEAGVRSRLLLIGDGSDEAELRSLAATVPGVTFVGFVQPADLPPWYAAADCFVFPTLGDPHGLVVEEAMAAGLPVISTTAAGDIVRRLVEPGAGLCVPPSDPDALADAMLLLATDPARRRTLGDAGRRAVRQRTHQHWADDFLDAVEAAHRRPPRIRVPAARRG